ncbi:MAG TPA: ATP-binding cassette domain-containing protein [Methanocorpusculum sp.]|nr:ATP-binding cassette domain-containing protein [Candidatus Methanocorpusculum faecipullorum]HJK00360.1 ATP-binding cassette domain-containing protein [Methanocorpusculum sp.]HJK03863.1 ATP-binding cassette domain-containing protein [Methanocorpusculum sp.]HJK04943.1 ATP-binding cassette domain-containing protein [Methanocorpusculum sp.]HJK05973.1 ATP-binding cassette domain-containing protein [Methanocorpusculum sp.]
MLEISGLTLSLGEFRFTDLSVSVANGEYCIILGPTGAGKTILLETIAGIHSPDKGQIFLDGADITNAPPEQRGIGMVYQDYMLFPHMTVKENIGFGLRQRGVPKGERDTAAETMAKTLGIAHLLDRYPATLSGGEQQRTAIARALVLNPRVLLLDEPLSALDTVTRDRMRREIKEIHRKTGVTILHITHHFEDIYALADRVVVMKDGEVAQEGTPETILRRPASDFIANFTGMENLFSGTAVCNEDGTAELSVGSVKLFAATDLTGQVRIGIRPEDLILSTKPLDSSARNSLPGTVTGIAENGIYSKISVECGDEMVLTAALTRQSVERLKLHTGAEVWVTFKATAVHVFR